MAPPVLDAQITASDDIGMPGVRCLANARIVLPDGIVHGKLILDGDRIAEIAPGTDLPRGALDCAGDYLLPGMVEVHTDNLERHIEPRPGVLLPHDTAILAHDGELASCGITTVFDALRIGSVDEASTNYGKYARSVASEILAMRQAGALRVRHLIHLRAEICSDTLVEEFAEFDESDRIRLVSMMDHTPGQRQFRDVSKLRSYLRGKYGYSDEMFAEHVARQVERRKAVGELHERTTVTEAKRLGATLASHDDTTAEQVAHSANLGISLAEFPTSIEAAESCRASGMQIIMGAPNLIRGGSHSGNVSAGELADRGLLDIVSSDYVPSLLLASAFRLAALWGDLPRAFRTVSTNPADATGLGDRGRLQASCLADFMRVGLHGETPVVRAVWRGGDRIA